MCRSTSRRSSCISRWRGCAANIPASPCCRSPPISPSRSICRRRPAGCRASGFFPGSTIGNFEPHEAAAFLRHAGRILGRGATFIVGVDLVKDTQVLQRAYNDSQGVTAQFNLNLLARINRELGAKFNLACFEHHAFFNRERSRIEMHLASLKRQRIKVCGECIDFRAGETIHTENSYKYSMESFGALARGAGWHRWRCGPTPECGFRRPGCLTLRGRGRNDRDPKQDSTWPWIWLDSHRRPSRAPLSPREARSWPRASAATSIAPINGRRASRNAVSLPGAAKRAGSRHRAGSRPSGRRA